MDNHTAKIKEILRGIDDEIEQYEKAQAEAYEHAKFVSGNIAGLRRARTTLEIFFHNDLKEETQHV
jgi:hypothetical protein